MKRRIRRRSEASKKGIQGNLGKNQEPKILYIYNIHILVMEGGLQRSLQFGG